MFTIDRRQYILDQLAEQGSVRIQELSQALQVSAMTIHRDLNRLEEDGLLRKVRGGAVPVPEVPPSPDQCVTCHGPTQRRNPMILHFRDGSHRRACCAHCGLLALTDISGQISSALVTDFLYGRAINALAASYVIDPQITICCTPTVLAFETRQEAQRFQQGFGGRVLDMNEALDYLQHEMSLARIHHHDTHQ